MSEPTKTRTDDLDREILEHVEFMAQCLADEIEMLQSDPVPSPGSPERYMNDLEISVLTAARLYFLDKASVFRDPNEVN